MNFHCRKVECFYEPLKLVNRLAGSFDCRIGSSGNPVRNSGVIILCLAVTESETVAADQPERGVKCQIAGTFYCL